MELHLPTELGRHLREGETQPQQETAEALPWREHLWLGSPCTSRAPLAAAVALGGDPREAPCRGASEILVAAAWRDSHSERYAEPLVSG